MNSPVIIFDDFTTACKWVDFPFKAKSSAMKMLTIKQGARALLRFVFYAMSCINYVPADHARHWISKYSKFKIPVPPLHVQQDIVRTLDSFDALLNDLSIGLPAELAARRQQYEYYRDRLLTFEEAPA
jgi:type I restriction enzyme S subunit